MEQLTAGMSLGHNMANFLIFILSGVAGLWVLWVMFLAVMTLKVARDNGTFAKDKDAYYIGMSVLFVGYLVDFLVNMLVATFLFLELPKLQLFKVNIRSYYFSVPWFRETTVTARVTRLKKEGGWRGDLARWLCAKLLDPFSIGGHCN